MGDVALDTAVERVDDGHFRAELSPEWEIWGPMGGYVAACRSAPRRARARSLDRQASSATTSSVAAFDRVDLEVSTLRAGRSALSQRVRVTQGCHADPRCPGLVRQSQRRARPRRRHATRRARTRHLASTGGARARSSLDLRILGQRGDAPDTFSFGVATPGPTCSAMADVVSLPAHGDVRRSLGGHVSVGDPDRRPELARRLAAPHVGREPHGFIAPSLDLYVAFHTPAPTEAWLLADGSAPVSGDGMLGWTGRLWTPEGSLVAAGGGQALYRRVPTSR